MMNSDLRIRVVPAIADVPAAAWDACALPDAKSQDRPYNPFISHAFLHALELSGSATARTGWQPQHLVAETADGRVLGVLPCYLKSHSRGEYVFDHGWADAYERAGGQYYPKLQASVPFTPVPGRRLLLKPSPDVERRQTTLATGAATLARQLGVSSLHVTFAAEDEWDFFGGCR